MEKLVFQKEQKPARQRVAVYCRDGADTGDATIRKAQEERLTQRVRETSGWALANVYTDAGAETRMDVREAFQRMLADCREGKLDKILVQSISRFARNTHDCLSVLRELASLGVSVRFEKEDIDTGAFV